MKKRFILFLVITLLFTFVGCGSKKEEEKKEEKQEQEVINYNGKYQKDNTVIKLFQITNESFSMDSDSVSLSLKKEKCKYI